ncbi:anoctamin-8-like [Sceloporus undulatus]|uniref:anoctamin-8-like n=1 Tax=Sceloporus undulatus TaxID=8520 RepID=UPI001C4AE8AA|nr:anoctamin-8-like [Sceloporus undulatus]
MELRAELTDRRGEKRPLRVRCEAPPGGLRALLGGLALLRERVSALLDPLVEQERGAHGDGPAPAGEEESEEEEEEEEEGLADAKPSPDGPPLKRTKMHS